MEGKLMVTEGYRIESETQLKAALKDFISRYPDFINDGAKSKDIVRLYRKRTKPYRHIVFIQMGENWFIKFLTDQEVLHHIPM